jgi:hypothetical protein
LRDIGDLAHAAGKDHVHALDERVDRVRAMSYAEPRPTVSAARSAATLFGVVSWAKTA